MRVYPGSPLSLSAVILMLCLLAPPLTVAQHETAHGPEQIDRGQRGGISTYAVKGKQYIAVTSGGGTLTFGGGGSPTLFVFSLPVKK